MTSLRRILRVLAVGGLIPLILAAGLPLRACACTADSPPTANCCCCRGADATSEDGKEGGCPCCKTPRRGGAAPAQGSDEPAAGKPDPALSLGCRCGGSNQPPAAPPSGSASAPDDLALPRAGCDVVPRRPAAAPSVERLRSALLPTADLTTKFCVLVI